MTYILRIFAIILLLHAGGGCLWLVASGWASVFGWWAISDLQITRILLMTLVSGLVGLLLWVGANDQ